MKITDLKTFVVGNPPPGFGGRYFIFVKLTTDNGIEGIGEVYCDTFGPQVMTQMIEDVFERHVAGHGSRSASRALWRKVYGTGYTLRPDISADGRPVRHRDRAVGHHRQGGRTSRSMSCWAARSMSGLRTYTYIYPDRPARTRAIYHECRACRRARGGLCEAGLHRGEVRSGGALFRLRSAPAIAGVAGAVRRSSAACCARRSAPRPISCSARTASSPRPAPSAWPSGSSPTIRCGSRNRRRRKCRRRWRWWRARPPFPIATGERLDDEVRIRPRARMPRRLDPANGAGPRRRHPGSEEDRRHGRDALCADRAASLLRPGRGCRQHPASPPRSRIS